MLCAAPPLRDGIARRSVHIYRDVYPNRRGPGGRIRPTVVAFGSSKSGGPGGDSSSPSGARTETNGRRATTNSTSGKRYPFLPLFGRVSAGLPAIRQAIRGFAGQVIWAGFLRSRNPGIWAPATIRPAWAITGPEERRSRG